MSEHTAYNNSVFETKLQDLESHAFRNRFISAFVIFDNQFYSTGTKHTLESLQIDIEVGKSGFEACIESFRVGICCLMISMNRRRSDFKKF